MKTLTNLLAALALASSTGCGLVQSLYQNTLACPRDFFEDRREEKRNRTLAEQALCSAASGLPSGANYSRDFADGFCEGFTDFMKNGGSGEPPPLPPRRYWSVRYQSSRGADATRDWFDGFRQGAGSARANGARLLVTVPTSENAGSTHGMPPITLLGPPLQGAPPPVPVPHAPLSSDAPRFGHPAIPEAKPMATLPAAISSEKPNADSPSIKVGVPAVLTPYEQLTLPPRFTTPPLPSQPPQPPLQRLGKPTTEG